jgi:hypothetical protein
MTFGIGEIGTIDVTAEQGGRVTIISITSSNKKVCEAAPLEFL